MWTNIAHKILKYRIALLIFLIIGTAIMGFLATKVKMTFKFAELIPKQHQEMQYFTQFKKTFGDDANVMVIGFKDDNIYKLENFMVYKEFCDKLNKVQGVEKSGVIALPTLRYFKSEGDGDTAFCTLKPVFDQEFLSQMHKVSKDSLQNWYNGKLELVRSLKIFDQVIFNHQTKATTVVIPLKTDFINSKKREALIKDIRILTEEFVAKVKIKESHLAGMPYVRTVMAQKVKVEMQLLCLYALIVTGGLLLFFYRSFSAMIYPLIVVGVTVIWSVGIMVILGYEISLLTGLIPSIIVVTGIPNCIYLLHRYHQEFAKHGNKIRAISAVVRRVGILALMTNATTAIGFLVLLFADITILREFGVAAGLDVCLTYLISVILIPVVFSLLPNPKERHLKHLEFKGMTGVLNWVDRVIANHRKYVYLVTCAIVAVCIYGSTKLYAHAYMIDDIPAESPIMKDLKFFEKNFAGVMPLEIVINTKNPKAYKNYKFLQKLNEFTTFLGEQKCLAPSLSMLNHLPNMID